MKKLAKYKYEVYLLIAVVTIFIFGKMIATEIILHKQINYIGEQAQQNIDDFKSGKYSKSERLERGRSLASYTSKVSKDAEIYED